MYEYEFYNKETDTHGIAFGYDEEDARRRFPKYADADKWHKVGRWYVD